MVTIRAGRLAALLCTAAVLTACAVPAPRPGVPVEARVGAVVVEPQPSVAVEAAPTVAPVPAPAPDRAEPPPSPAALALAAQSEQALAAGDLRLAGVQLERALRIAPRDASLWNRLAQVRLQQGEYQQAERMAERSLQLALGDRNLELANWRVILQAREALGDTEGARRAREEVRRLERALG